MRERREIKRKLEKIKDNEKKSCDNGFPAHHFRDGYIQALEWVLKIRNGGKKK